MSFNFEWPTFSDDFYADAKEMLAQALNKGEKPPIIADRIEVKELNMGTIPPELEILEIGDLSTDRFRGIFRLTYAGDAFIVLQTKVQANPLNVPRPSLDILGAPRILFAAAPLVVPMTLQLSALSLRAIVVLVVSRQKGITLVFKNDPLESVNVSSSFDGVESVAGFIQTEIEAQLREAFRSDLPSIIHRLSQKWLSGEVKTASEETAAAMPKTGSLAPQGFAKDAKIQTKTAYMRKGGTKTGHDRRLTTRMSTMSLGAESVSIGSDVDTTFSTQDQVETRSLYRKSSQGRRSVFGSPTKQRTSSSQTIKPEPQSVPESIESYDPTYGLRPDSIPSHAGFGQYQRLVQSGTAVRGLGGVLDRASQEVDDYDDDELLQEEDPFEIDLADEVGLERELAEPVTVGVDTFDDRQARRRSYQSLGRETATSDNGLGAAVLETIPAVGGGTITRPRILHTQSQMRTRAVSNSSLSAHGSPSTMATHVPESTTSTIGELLGSPVFRPFQDDRLEHLASQSRAGSGTSTPRFPFPRMPSKAPSFASAPTLSRQNSTQSARPFRGPHQVHRSGLSHFSTTSVDADATSALSMEPTPDLTNAVVPDEPEVFPKPRPDPIDLLSRSPSSVLNHSSYEDDLGITINPNSNDSCAHLATLTHSNQTLSPFTRSHEHFTARSSPHVLNRGFNGPTMTGAGEGGSLARLTVPRLGSIVDTKLATSGGDPVKAKRKRIYRIGSAAGGVLGTSSARGGGASSDGHSVVAASSSRTGSGGHADDFAGGRFSRRSSLLTRGASSIRSSSLAPQTRVSASGGVGVGGGGSNRHGRTLSLDARSGTSRGLSANDSAGLDYALSEMSEYFPSTAHLMAEMRRKMATGLVV
ncbi:hypothetical protein ACM66B_005408 [Microbotryomycetes sp. NB124-2]